MVNSNMEIMINSMAPAFRFLQQHLQDATPSSSLVEAVKMSSILLPVAVKFGTAIETYEI